jgi:hypothetical protein
MQSSGPISAERQAIHTALVRVERRLRLNRLLYVAALVAGLALLALVTWRVLDWLDGTAPAASALVVLFATLGVIAIVLLLLQRLLAGPVDMAGAAKEADRRGALHDELSSAFWFMRAADRQQPAARDWVEAQLRRAARTASGLQAARLVPLRLPRSMLAGLGVGALVLALAWSASPLTPADAARVSGAVAAGRSDAQVAAMRQLVEGLPRNEATRKLEAALRTLESGTASADERRRAIAQAQEAVDQIRMNAAASREGLQKLSQMLAGQEGMEEVAEALAKGDAKRAAELIAKVQAENQGTGSGNAPDPAEGAGERPLEQAMQALTDSLAEPQQGARPTAEAMQVTVDRLNEIARQLQAANYVNDAWKEVKGPQLTPTQGGALTAGRYDEQQQAAGGNPSPGAGETPMGGGTMFRSAAVAQGQGTEEQEGGTRMGDAFGEGGVDPLLGEGAERLDSQLRQHALTGQEDAQQDPDQAWFYSESQKRGVQAAWRTVEARARFSEAEAAAAGGISIKHRQITKDYFMNRPETAK